MAQIQDIQMSQRALEECVLKKMNELQAQLQSGEAAKDTVARVAEEFRAFREITFTMLGLLRKQITECVKAVDVLETRQRRKTLIFSGITESEKENCLSLVLGILHKQMELKEVSGSCISVCHRLGVSEKGKSRPILVKFISIDVKAAVWRAKTKLKGSPTSVKEFLTKTRQSVFGKARLHFGMRDCWTRDGTIIVKAPDGSQHKVTSMDELDPLLEKYPQAAKTTLASASR